MDDKEHIKSDLFILLFGGTSFLLGLIATPFIIFLIIEFRLLELLASGIWQRLGESSIPLYGMVLTFYFGPLIAEVTGLTFYGIGYLIAHSINDQSNSRNYWLLYPIVSITIVIGYYILFTFGFLPFS